MQLFRAYLIIHLEIFFSILMHVWHIIHSHGQNEEIYNKLNKPLSRIIARLSKIISFSYQYNNFSIRLILYNTFPLEVYPIKVAVIQAMVEVAVEHWRETRLSPHRVCRREHLALQIIGDHHLKSEHSIRTDGIMFNMNLYMPPLRIHLAEAQGQ